MENVDHCNPLHSHYLEEKNMKSIEEILRIQTSPSVSEIRLFERAQKYLRFVSWIPGLRMVAVCNSLSMYASDEGSDIDLFVVTDPGRMWFVRIALSGVFQLLGVRRHGEHVAGRFCLSFFSTTEALDFSTFAIEDDVYLKTWIEHLKPILDIGNTYAEFLEKNSKWTNAQPTADARRFRIIEKPLPKEWFGGLWNLVNRALRRIFEPVTLREYERLGKPWGIIISENMLKFHREDARIEIREEWQAGKAD